MDLRPYLSEFSKFEVFRSVAELVVIEVLDKVLFRLRVRVPLPLGAWGRYEEPLGLLAALVADDRSLWV